MASWRIAFRGATRLLRATATCKRWHNMDLNGVWKQLVLARWPAAAALNVQDFKRFYRSHHVSLVLNHGGPTPEIDAAAAQDPAGIQFIVDMGLSLRGGRRSILSVVLDGSEAQAAWTRRVSATSLHFKLVRTARGGWTVDPLFDEMRARIHDAKVRSRRTEVRDAATSSGPDLFLSRLRRSANPTRARAFSLTASRREDAQWLPTGIEDNRIAYEKQAVSLPGGCALQVHFDVRLLFSGVETRRRSLLGCLASISRGR